MPTWLSKDGKWEPRKERVSLFDKDGSPYIYEGPDRAAVQILKENGEEYLGQDFRDDPEIIERAHDRKMDIDQYCKTSINTEEKRQAAYKKDKAQVNLHKVPSKVPDTAKVSSGGDDTSGMGNHAKGGFGKSHAKAVEEAVDSVKK